MALVSVVVPTYQRRDVVVEAVESALAQGEPVEVLVVDDGSTDGTADACRARFGADPRVRVLRQENGGSAAARNTGIDAATGTYVALLDDDDLLLPGHVATLRGALEAHPEADLALGDAVYEGPWRHDRTSVFGRRGYRPPTSLDDMLEGLWAVPSASMWRAARLKALRFDPAQRWSEDTELLFRFFAAGGRAVAVPRAVTRYRHLGGARGAPNKMDRADRIQAARLELQARYAHLARDPRGHAVRLHRRWVRQHRRTGDLGAAWPHVRAWARATPWSPAPWLALAKSWWRAGRRPTPAEGPTEAEPS